MPLVNQQTGATSGGSNIPPPPTEVMIRTMVSDLASLGANGGNRARPEVVVVGATPTPAAPSSPRRGTRIFVYISLGIILLAIIAFVVIISWPK